MRESTDQEFTSETERTYFEMQWSFIMLYRLQHYVNKIPVKHGDGAKTNCGIACILIGSPIDYLCCSLTHHAWRVMINVLLFVYLPAWPQLLVVKFVCVLN